MANKKLQFTYLWADEDVMRDDFAKGLSQGMTDWAVDFYARYDFDVNVNPPPDGKPRVLSLSKFALQKSDGIRPDRRTFEEQNKALNERMRRNEEERDRLRKAQDQADAANNRTESDRLDALIKDLDKKHDALFEQLMSSYDRQENQLRELLMLKYLKDRILHPERFTVVFCRFQYTSAMGMRLPKKGSPGQTFGTKAELPVRLFPTVVLPLWPDRFAIVDPFHGERRTVAHEAVHAAGHDHPIGLYLDSVEKTYRGRRLPTKGFDLPRRRPASLSPDIDDPAFDFDEVAHYEHLSGMDDGPKDDLMNYTLQDPGPRSVNLRPEHVELMKNAYFAK